MTYTTMISAGDRASSENLEETGRRLRSHAYAKATRRLKRPLRPDEKAKIDAAVERELDRGSSAQLGVAVGVAALPFTVILAGPLVGTYVAYRIGRAVFHVAEAGMDDTINNLIKAGLSVGAAGVGVSHGHK
jgi:hypothetical protein